MTLPSPEHSESEKMTSLITPEETLAFFASVIRCGEPFSPACAKAYADAKDVLAARATAASGILRALEDFMRLADDSKASTKNPNTTFVDTRDLQAFVANARALVSSARTAGIK